LNVRGPTSASPAPGRPKAGEVPSGDRPAYSPAEGQSSHRADLIGGAGWIVFGLAVFIGAWRMDRFEAMGATIYTMPGLVPGLIGLLLMLLGGVLALRGWRQRALQAGSSEPVLNRRLVVTLVLMLVYAGLLVGRTPFWLATALFVAAFTAVFTPPQTPRLRRVLGSLVAGALTSLIVVLVFEQVFLVRLP